MNEEDVGQTLCLMNVVKGLSRFRGSFVTLDARKLVVRQVKATNGHTFFNAFLILLQHFGIRIGRWRFIESIHNIQRSMDANNILILNFQRLIFSPLNLSMIIAASLSNDVIVRLDLC